MNLPSVIRPLHLTATKGENIMSPTAGLQAVPMQPTPVFGNMPKEFSPEMMPTTFPVTQAAIKAGIKNYREEKGYSTAPDYEVFADVADTLPFKTFRAAGRSWRVENVRVHPLANPIAAPRQTIGDVERFVELFIPSIAAAIGAAEFMGRGGLEGIDKSAHKDAADAAATIAMREALNRLYMRGKIRGGEGGGRDGQTRLGALLLNELVGRKGGKKINFYVDPLEVTNATAALNTTGAWGGVGQGWAPELANPAHWYPGYSGASTLLLAMNGDEGKARALSDFLYLNKLQFNHRIWDKLRTNGFSINMKPGDLVEGIADALKKAPEELAAAALARSRHMKTMMGWIEAGLKPWKISTPSDGDAIFAPALAAGALDFAGLTGGVVEGAVASALGIPLGIRTFFQFASHDRLGEHKEMADLTREDHRFGFSMRERQQMRLTKLFDSQHIGNTLRQDDPAILDTITHAAWDRLGQPAYENFYERFLAISGVDTPFAEPERSALMDTIDGAKKGTLTREAVQAIMDGIVRQRIQGTRFTDKERRVMADALREVDYHDVREQFQFGDLMTGTQDWLALVSAITPNKWAPLDGIRTDETHGARTVSTLAVAGSHAVYTVETTVVPQD